MTHQTAPGPFLGALNKTGAPRVGFHIATNIQEVLIVVNRVISMPALINVTEATEIVALQQIA